MQRVLSWNALKALTAVVCVAGAAACAEGPAAPSPPEQEPFVSVVSDTLEPGGTVAFFFDLDFKAKVNTTLAGLMADGETRTLDTAVNLKVGRIAADLTCAELLKVDTRPSLKAQLPLFLEGGSYCVEVTDIGGLTEPVGALVRVVGVPFPDESTGGTDTWSSNLAFEGSAIRTFVAGAAGTARVTLSSLGAPAGSTVSLALGLYSSDRGCLPHTVVQVTAGGGPQIVASIDSGVYCVRLFNLSAPQPQTSFTIAIDHP